MWLQGPSTSQQLLSPDQSKLLAQITGQLAESTRLDKEAACNEVRAACEKEHGETYKKLEEVALQEKEQLMQQHRSALAEAVDMSARRKQGTSQLTFTVRGNTTPQLSGSIPRQVFEAEPNSVLNNMYNGDWAYATDDDGRACINSDPEHWPLILNWLSFGSVPTQPSEGFIGECKYWQLDNLLLRMELQRKAADELAITTKTSQHSFIVTHLCSNGRDGFQLQADINSFRKRWSSGKAIILDFEAFGVEWKLSIAETGVALLVTGTERVSGGVLSCSCGEDAHSTLGPIKWDDDTSMSWWELDWPDHSKPGRVQYHPQVGLAPCMSR